jgi:hypothetical protein
LRDGLGRMAQLAEGADQGEALLRRLRRERPARLASTQSERVQALERSCHHLSSLQRLLAGATPAHRARVASAVAQALYSACAALADGAPLELRELEALADAAPAQHPRIAGPAHLLARDLRLVCAAGAPSAAPWAPADTTGPSWSPANPNPPSS